MSNNEGTGRVDVAFTVDFQVLIDSDVDGLLDAPAKPKKVTSADRLERAFLEVLEFRRTHGRVPSSTTREIAERKLGARLDGILANEDKIAALKPLDEFGLLETPEAPASIDELMEADDFDLLGDESGLLDVSDLPARSRGMPVVTQLDGAGLMTSSSSSPSSSKKHAELRAGTSKLLPYPGLANIVP